MSGHIFGHALYSARTVDTSFRYLPIGVSIPKGRVLVSPQTSETGRFDFHIVDSASEQSPGTIKNGIVTCPDPRCGSTTPRGYVAEQAQAGQLGHQLYCVIYRDQWRPKNKSGTFAKRPKTSRGFRLVTTEDDNTTEIVAPPRRAKARMGRC